MAVIATPNFNRVDDNVRKMANLINRHYNTLDIDGVTVGSVALRGRIGSELEFLSEYLGDVIAVWKKWEEHMMVNDENVKVFKEIHDEAKKDVEG